jgi:hypothetical protein
LVEQIVSSVLLILKELLEEDVLGMRDMKPGTELIINELVSVCLHYNWDIISLFTER